MVIPNLEGKCCDAVIRQMERGAGKSRTAVLDPELTGEGPPVDLRVEIASRKYALEHTRILPFGERIEVTKAYKDISAGLAEMLPSPLPGDAFYQLHVPHNVQRPGRGKLGERRLRRLSDWVKSEVDELQARAPGRCRWPPDVYGLDSVSGRPDGWECEFTLMRSSDGILPPHEAGSISVLVGYPEHPETAFVVNLRRALQQKCPKLAQCKALSADIATVLVLETVDRPFDFDRCIGEHLAGLLEDCVAVPDWIFLVCPDALLWQVWVVKAHEVQWFDRRLPMPHKGYRDPPKLVPEEAYPKQIVEHFNRTFGTADPGKWLPYFARENDLEDAKGRSAYTSA